MSWVATVVVPGVGLLTRLDVSTSSTFGHGLAGGGHDGGATTALSRGGLEGCLLPGICLNAVGGLLDRALVAGAK